MKSVLLIVAVASLTVLPAATAQDGCDEADPCHWVVEIDGDGLAASGGELEGTVGDWFMFDLHSVDPDDEHTVTWSLDGTSWEVPPFGSVESDPFELTQEGTFQLRDTPTDDTLAVTISLNDVANGDGEEGNGAPGPGLLPLLGSLGALAWARRR